MCWADEREIEGGKCAAEQDAKCFLWGKTEFSFQAISPAVTFSFFFSRDETHFRAAPEENTFCKSLLRSLVILLPGL